MKENKTSWVSFFQWLRSRGLNGVKLIVGDKCLGMLEAVGEVFPEAKYQRCTVHFYRNVFSVTPRSKVKLVAKMLKAIHAQENKKAAREKAKAVVEQLLSMKLKEAAKKVENGIEETLTYCDFPSEHWTRIRTNNVIERLNREIRRRTRVVGSFPDGNSALMLVCARLRHVAGTQWGNKKYMNMKHLEAAVEDASIAGLPHSSRSLQTNFAQNPTLPPQLYPLSLFESVQRRPIHQRFLFPDGPVNSPKLKGAGKSHGFPTPFQCDVSGSSYYCRKVIE